MLPENKKVLRDSTQALKLWVYGKPNIGKTTFANQFPDTLMLNTDGNYKFVDSPVVTIGGENAWDDFITIIKELLQDKHTYKTIVIDLVEDLYQYCRDYYLKQLKIVHEADLGYGKGYDIIRNNFLIALRILCNSKYNIVLCSHEQEVSIKDRVGRETTVFKPNLNDKVSTKVSGMVELTGRLYSETETDESGNEVEKRTLFFGSSSDMFTGNKIKSLKVDRILMSETKGYTNLVNAIKEPCNLTSDVLTTTTFKEDVKKEESIKVEEQVLDQKSVVDTPILLKRKRDIK